MQRLSAALTLVALSAAAATALNQAGLNKAGKAWWKNIQFLASDKLEGRKVGSAGFDKAADYVAAQFKKADLQAAGTDGYFQPVAFTETTLNSWNLALVRGGKSVAVPVPGEATLSYSPESAPIIEAPVVFAGYGLVIPEANHNDLEGLPVKGAIVAYLTGGPDKISGNLRSHYSSGEERWKALRAAGAIGTISIANPKTMEIPWLRASTTWGMPGMSLSDTKLTGMQGKLFGANWDPAKANDLFEGSGHSFEEVLSAANTQQPLPHFALTCTVKASVSISKRPIGSMNVIGLRMGSDSKLEDEYVVISAHLDHLGIGKPGNGDRIFNGAMDDASGVASVIEIAKAFAKDGINTKRSVLFLAVTGEEEGELGSTYFAQYPTVKGKIVADINMDMFLPLFPLKWLEVQGLNESSLGGDIRAVAEAAGVKVQADKEPNRNRFIRSDQYSFVKKGVPALAFKFGYQPGDPEEKIFKDWYTNRYHGVTDDLKQPVDLAAAAKFNDILTSLLIRVADADRAPEWQADSFFKRFAASAE